MRAFLPLVLALASASSDVLRSAGVRARDDLTSPATIKRLCREHVPGWRALSDAQIDVRRVDAGLTNTLFRVGSGGGATGSVLFRVFGAETGDFYDPVTEMRTFETLARYGFGPRLIARDDERARARWRMEEWYDDASEVTTEMLWSPEARDSIFEQLAAQLATLHKLSRRPDFPRSLQAASSGAPAIERWLGDWTAAAVRKGVARAGLDIDLDAMRAEAEWLADEIRAKRDAARAAAARASSPAAGAALLASSGFDLVFGHNDCQAANLLLRRDGPAAACGALRMIDFEYAGANLQACDLAAVFNECAMDYSADAAARAGGRGFAADPRVGARGYPGVSAQQTLARAYLRAYAGDAAGADERAVARLLSAVELLRMAQLVAWGMWAVVRAPSDKPAPGEFDFLALSEFYFESYRRLKREYVQSEAAAAPARARRHIELLPRLVPGLRLGRMCGGWRAGT